MGWEHLEKILNDPSQLCYECKGKPDGIFVRRTIDGRRQTVAICDKCWYEQGPKRVPVRVVS